MSSVPYNDTTCQSVAEQASCMAMRALSLKAAREDALHQSYLTHDPSCFRYQDLADRGLEHRLQKDLGISRNVCFERPADFQRGEWENGFPPMTVQLPTFYEQWTRAKNQRLTCQPTERPACFQSVTQTPFPGPCGFTLRR